MSLQKQLRRWRRRWVYKNPLSLLNLESGVRIKEVKRAQSPVLVERGRDDSTLVIAFTGANRLLLMPVYEFFETTKTMGCSRILLCDQYRQHYERGIDERRPDFPSLIAYLKQEIARLGPKIILCIGTSAGGYAAIRAGHQLRADYVHAFGAQTGDPPPGSSRRGRPEKAPPDLAQILKHSNEKTIYYLHYCRDCGDDRYHAERLFKSPGVAALGYHCAAHDVATFLGKKGFLTEFLAIANQDRLVELAKAHFGDSVHINRPPSKKRSAPQHLDHFLPH